MTDETLYALVLGFGVASAAADFGALVYVRWAYRNWDPALLLVGALVLAVNAILAALVWL